MSAIKQFIETGLTRASAEPVEVKKQKQPISWDRKSTRKPRILVVDDEERNLQLLEAVIIPLGYEVEFAMNGREAIEKAVSAKPDVILLDIMMPELDGFDAAKAIKNSVATGHIPIIMVTSLKESEQKIQAYELGVDDFISKPFDQTEVRARIKSLIKVKQYNDMLRNYQQALEMQLREKTEDLEQALSKLQFASRDTIHRLSAAAEYKDEDTGYHILRVMNFSALLARKIGFEESHVERILFAAPMHDIGKIGIPDHILLKEDKLTDEEWDIMKKHTEIGADILNDSEDENIQTAKIIALSHHEKWDGSGYPNGLKGEEIPIEGRITAVADVFDALTSRRPYKKPFPLEKALGIIKEGRGRHFDPAIVDVFFESMDDILEIQSKYSDCNTSKFLEMVKDKL